MKTAPSKPGKELLMNATAFDEIMRKALQVRPEEVTPKKRVKAKKKRASR